MMVVRPENAVPRSMLSVYERMGWWAQAKMNGAYTQVTTQDGVVVDARSRRDELHKQWTLGAESRASWALAPRGRWVFVAELLHTKVPGIRDTHYVHDVLVADGRSLLGVSYRERWKILGDSFGFEVREETDTHWILRPGMWLARCWKPGIDYAALFGTMTGHRAVEGLVVKNPDAPLRSRDASWCVKCRLPGKNLSF